MKHDPNLSPYQLIDTNYPLDRPEDFLSPQQRVNAIAEILATIAWRIAQESYEQDKTTF